MSNQTKANQTKIRETIQSYVDKTGITTTRRIAEHVKSVIGILPSPSTVSAILQELGYEPIKQPRFVWRHNPNKGE